jgi:putative ABC transport system permease protein
VVVVVSLIQGFNQYIEEKIAGIGSKTFTIRRFNFDDFKNTDTITVAQRRNKELTFEDYEYIRSRAKLIGSIGAKANASSANIKRGSETVESVRVDGTTANCADIENIDIAEGRYFSEPENESAQNVVFLGADVANKLFPLISPIGQEVLIRGLPYRVIGVAEAKGTVFGMPQDNFATIPLKTYIKTFGPAVRQRSFYMVANAVDDARFNDAVEEARYLMRTRRQLSADEKDNFGIGTPDAVLGFRDRVLGPIFIVAIAVPAIALVVGGIVIMNIMLVSVTERTKEIGIRKALGARRNDILKQFMIEAVVLSAIGGSVGVLIAWGLGKIVTAVFFQTYLSIMAVITAVGVSGLIGVISGVLPARKAATLDPIEALRAD